MTDGIQFSVTIDTSGYKKVEKDLPQAIEKALYQMGVLAVEGAVRSISGQYTVDNKAVDTGRLRASISFITEKDKGDSGIPQPPNAEAGDKLSGNGEKDFVIVGTNVNYAQIVHNGTSKRTGRPFLREGIDKKKEEMQEKVKDILKQGD